MLNEYGFLNMCFKVKCVDVYLSVIVTNFYNISRYTYSMVIILYKSLFYNIQHYSQEAAHCRTPNAEYKTR